MAKLISRTYGEALFELALEKQMLDTILEETKAVREVFSSNVDFMKFLNHPQITREEKISITEKIFKDRISEEVISFLVIIMEKGRYNEIIYIIDYFIARVKEYKNIGVAEIFSATQLSKEQKNNLEEKLLSTTKYVEFEMNYHVDNSLIGGVIVRIGDRVVDGSIKAKLAQLVKDLQKIQLSKV